MSPAVQRTMLRCRDLSAGSSIDSQSTVLFSCISVQLIFMDINSCHFQTSSPESHAEPKCGPDRGATCVSRMLHSCIDWTCSRASRKTETPFTESVIRFEPPSPLMSLSRSAAEEMLCNAVFSANHSCLYSNLLPCDWLE